MHELHVNSFVLFFPCLQKRLEHQRLKSFLDAATGDARNAARPTGTIKIKKGKSRAEQSIGDVTVR